MRLVVDVTSVDQFDVVPVRCHEELEVPITKEDFVTPIADGMNALFKQTRYRSRTLVLSKTEAAMIGGSIQFSGILHYTAHDEELVRLVLRRIFNLQVEIEPPPPDQKEKP